MKYSQIKPNDIVNGEGISVSLWTQGCPHHGKGCFNQSTWNYEDGKEFTQADCDYILSILNHHKIAHYSLYCKFFPEFFVKITVFCIFLSLSLFKFNNLR